MENETNKIGFEAALELMKDANRNYSPTDRVEESKRLVNSLSEEGLSKLLEEHRKYAEGLRNEAFKTIKLASPQEEKCLNEFFEHVLENKTLPNHYKIRQLTREYGDLITLAQDCLSRFKEEEKRKIDNQKKIKKSSYSKALQFFGLKKNNNIQVKSTKKNGTPLEHDKFSSPINVNSRPGAMSRNIKQVVFRGAQSLLPLRKR